MCVSASLVFPGWAGWDTRSVYIIIIGTIRLSLVVVRLRHRWRRLYPLSSLPPARPRPSASSASSQRWRARPCGTAWRLQAA
eukprot:9143732-Pyramimonas_sp.AAC.1